MKDGLIKRGGSWSFVIDVGDQPAQRCERCGKRRWVDGEPLEACAHCGGALRTVRERRQRWHSGYPTKAAAKAARDEARVRLARGAYVPPSTTTVEEYLLDWLDGMARQRKAGTVASYRHKLTRYVIPAVGSIRLQPLGARHLEALYVDLVERGGPGGPLSVSTVRTIHAILRKALQDAYRRDEVALNVAAKASVPARRADAGDGPTREGAGGPALRSWDSEQVRAFVAALDGVRLGPAYVLAVNTGMRRGEVLGLSWADVDLAAPRLTVRQSLVSVNGYTQLTTPKTGKPRSFTLDEVSVAALRQFRAVQRRERLLWGEAWQDTGLVFTQEDGTRVQPESFTKVFRAVVRGAGLPLIRFHDSRHTYATLALQAGVGIKVVSQRLGHANVGITWDTYAHVLPDDDEHAAALFHRHVYGGGA